MAFCRQTRRDASFPVSSEETARWMPFDRLAAAKMHLGGLRGRLRVATSRYPILSQKNQATHGDVRPRGDQGDDAGAF